MAALFVAEEWDRVGNPMAVLNSQLASQSAEERETHCMVLRVHDEKERDGHNKVNIMTPCFDEDAKDEVKDKEPDCNWLLSPETYFTQVSRDWDVQTIVGHFPVTSAAAFVLRKRLFPSAKVILINHGIPASLSGNHLNEAAKADVVFSVGQKAFKYFSMQYIPRKACVQHKLYLPRPDKNFFALDINFDEEKKKQVLMTTVGSQIDSEFNQILAGVIGDVADSFQPMYIELPSWHIQTNIPQNCYLVAEKLVSHSNVKYITPNIKPSFGSQDEFCTELVRSYLCIIPPDESYGMQGLECIAAGLPVLAPKESSVDYLINMLCPEFAELLLYDSTSKEDLFNKIKAALLKPGIATIRAKKLKKKYKKNSRVSKTHREFFAYFMDPSASRADHDIGPTSPASERSLLDDSGISLDGSQPQSPRVDKVESTDADVSHSADDKANTQQQELRAERKRKHKPNVKAEVSWEVDKKKLKQDSIEEGEEKVLEKETQCDFQKETNISDLVNKYFDSVSKVITTSDKSMEDKIQALNNAFELCHAKLLKPEEGSLIFPLSYLSVDDMDNFWERYESGKVEEILTAILIPPEIQAKANDAGFTVRIVLKIDEMEFNEVKKLMKEMSVTSPSEKTLPVPIYDIWKRLVLADVPDIYYARYLIDQHRFNPVFNTLRQEEFFYPAFLSYWHQKKNWCPSPPTVTKATQYTTTYRSPVYSNWERYVLDNVPNIHHARYLIEQLRFDPVFNMLRQEEFFYPAFVSYWQQKENLYSLPPTVTKATQYAIMYHFQINSKEHDLDKDRAWSALQERFQEIGKVLYDNISEESIGKLYTSWFDSGIISTELHGMVENCGDYNRFNSLFIYAYIIACYVCADIKSGGKCLDQLMEEKMFTFLKKMLPYRYLYLYIPGILGDHAEIAFLKEYIQHLLTKKDDVNVCLERLGYCLLESNCASELAADVEDMVGQQILDISNCTTLLNQSLHAFAAVIQNTSIIQEVVIHSEREIYTFSSEFKECIDKFSSEAKTTDELSIFIKDQHEFISFVKLLRALPILKCFHNRTESAHCYIPDMKSVKVTATSTIDPIGQGFVEMLVQALEWMPLLQRLDLVKVSPVSSNILKCMANVKPKLSISMFGLAENELSFHDCEMIVKATSSMPYLRHLDLKNNKIGSVGCAALLPIKDYMEVIIDGNGVGKGLSDILKVACNQVDLPDVNSNEIQTLADFYQLQRSLDTVTKLDTSKVPHSRFEKFCDSLSLFTKTKHLKYHCNKSVTLNELELLIASLHHLKNMTHFDIREIQVDTKFLEDFISDHPSLSGQTLAMPFINKIFLSIQPSLTNLSICRSNICKAFSGESIKHLTNLVKLDLSHNKLSGSDLGNINIPDSIVSVNVSHNSIESINDVSFKHCQKLTDINMSHNEMQSPLKDTLQILPSTIQYCDFSNNNITDVSDVGKLLDNFQNIKHLNLGSNRFGAFGVYTLLHDITKLDMQSKIDVSHNFSYLYNYVRDQLSNMLAFPDIEKSNIMLNSKYLMFVIEVISRITTLNIEVPATLTEVDKQIMFSDMTLLQAVQHLKFNEIRDKDLKEIVVSLKLLENLKSADFSDTGISIQGICTLYKFKCQLKRKLDINVASNLTDLSAVLPHIKDQLPSYSEGVDLDSDRLLVDQLKFCEEVCKITRIKLSTMGLRNPQVRKLCSGMKHLPELCHVDLSFNDMEQYVVRTLSTELQTGTLNLKSLDLSHNRIDDRGTKSLSLGLQEMSDLEQLDLCYNNITDRGAGYLGQAELWMQNVTYLDLSHNSIGNKGTQSLGEGMGKISQLRHLDLSHNRIGDHGVVSLSEGFQRMTPCVLTYLDLSNNKISESDRESLMMAVHSIRHLDLSHNQISNFGVERFNIEGVNWEELRHLDLNNNNIDDLGAASLSYGIEKMVKLQHLNLSNNSIADYGAECLSVGMERIGELTHVNLSHNQIGPTGAGHLGEGIATMDQLTELDLSNNEISDTGAKAFSESFTEGKKMISLYCLSRLNLSNNGIGDSGTESLSQAVKTMKQLTRLDLSHNDISNIGAECLSETIEILTNLTHLSLGHNQIGVPGADSLTREVEQSKRPIVLDLSHNDIEA